MRVLNANIIFQALNTDTGAGSIRNILQNKRKKSDYAKRQW